MADVETGMVFKNYRALCAHLGAPVVSGNSRISQWKKWGECFDVIRRRNNSLVIGEVRKQWSPVNGGFRPSGRWATDLGPLILDAASQYANPMGNKYRENLGRKYEAIVMPKRQLLVRIGLLKNDALSLHEFEPETQIAIADAVGVSRTRAITITETLLSFLGRTLDNSLGSMSAGGLLNVIPAIYAIRSEKDLPEGNRRRPPIRLTRLRPEDDFDESEFARSMHLEQVSLSHPLVSAPSFGDMVRRNRYEVWKEIFMDLVGEDEILRAVYAQRMSLIRLSDAALEYSATYMLTPSLRVYHQTEFKKNLRTHMFESFGEHGTRLYNFWIRKDGLEHPLLDGYDLEQEERRQADPDLIPLGDE